MKKINLPLGKYTIVGSGAMAVRNIREANDIDLVVTQDLYAQLKANGWEEKFDLNSPKASVLCKGIIEAYVSWSIEGFKPTTEELINNSDVFDGIAFVRLQDVLEWKKLRKRGKDLKDIELINNYLLIQGR